MPLLIKDYSWRQSEETIIIQVPLKGTHRSKVDLFTGDDYIKASFPPFLFEVFLSAPVNDAESKCILAAEEFVLELQKQIPGHWEVLEADLTKDQKKDCRARNLELKQAREQEKAKEKAAQKAELQRVAVRKQISADTELIKAVERHKNSVKATAIADLEAWKMKQKSTCKIFEITDKVLVKRAKPKPKVTKEKVREVPLPRQSGSIEIRFTPREFPTPSRESRRPEEEEWLKTQYEARKSVGFVAEDLSYEEQDPVWLKEKGDSFFQSKNYLGAVSAYSHAITIGSKMPGLYSNRAAAHIALGNLHKAVEDCSTALELLKPCIDLNADSRLKCHVRRAAALCSLGLPKLGIPDLDEAIKISPNNQDLRADLDKAKCIVDSESSDSDK